MLVERVFVLVLCVYGVLKPLIIHWRQHRTRHFMVMKVVFEGRNEEVGCVFACVI